MALEEEHHLLDGFLLLPGACDSGHALFAHAQYFAQALRVLLDDAQRIHLETAHDAPRCHRADSFDEARAQVLFDAGRGGRQHGGIALDLELAAVAGMGRPLPVQPQALARADFQQVADHRHGVLPALGCDLGDGIAVLLVVVGHPLDGADQGF